MIPMFIFPEYACFANSNIRILFVELGVFSSATNQHEWRRGDEWAKESLVYVVFVVIDPGSL
jgi:hypothetical protein